MNSKTNIFSILIIWVCGLTGLLAAPADAFKAANQLYDADKFIEATSAYEKLQPKTAPIYFNLGNAYFRQEKIGPAILNYERARRLAPRDPDILANLKFARQRLGVEDVSTSPRAVQRVWQSVVASRTASEWSAYELAGLWLTVLAVAGCIWLPKLRPGLAVLAVACGAWLVVTAAILGYQVTTERSEPSAIVLVTKAPARFAPLPDATVHFQLSEGTKVILREDRGQWMYVERVDGQQGWVNAETIEKI